MLKAPRSWIARRVPTTCRASPAISTVGADESNALGVKGAGQAGCMSAPQTIMSAILDALRRWA